METIINIIQLISDNRFWLLPLILVASLGMLVVEIKGVFVSIMEELE